MGIYNTGLNAFLSEYIPWDTQEIFVSRYEKINLYFTKTWSDPNENAQ